MQFGYQNYHNKNKISINNKECTTFYVVQLFGLHPLKYSSPIHNVSELLHDLLHGVNETLLRLFLVNNNLKEM